MSYYDDYEDYLESLECSMDENDYHIVTDYREEHRKCALYEIMRLER